MAEDKTGQNAISGAAMKISDDMSLEEKLNAIDQMMKQAQLDANKKAAAQGAVAAPVDPADLTMCLGCQ